MRDIRSPRFCLSILAVLIWRSELNLFHEFPTEFCYFNFKFPLPTMILTFLLTPTRFHSLVRVFEFLFVLANPLIHPRSRNLGSPAVQQLKFFWPRSRCPHARPHERPVSRLTLDSVSHFRFIIVISPTRSFPLFPRSHHLRRSSPDVTRWTVSPASSVVVCNRPRRDTLDSKPSRAFQLAFDPSPRFFTQTPVP